jgi:hypothetical protein
MANPNEIARDDAARWDELSKLPFKENFPTPEASAFRLYAPTEAHFNRTWVLPGFERVK